MHTQQLNVEVLMQVPPGQFAITFAAAGNIDSGMLFQYIICKIPSIPIYLTIYSSLMHAEPIMVSTDPDTADLIEQSAFIALPVSLFEEINTTDVGVFFTFYETAALFPLRGDLPDNFTVGTSVIGAAVAGEIFQNLSEPIVITLQMLNEVGPI